MNSVCKIITYHYVRSIQKSKYPRIKGLEVDAFVKQINYFKNNFNFINVEQLLDCIYKKKTLPKNSILLTFDDGLKDHYAYVFPLLKKAGIQGLFFPPAQAIQENKVLDVHKIHFILEKSSEIKKTLDEIRQLIKSHEEECFLSSIDSHFTEFVSLDRFDTKEVAFVKNILQKYLPRKLRNKIVDTLFTTHVTNDQNLFAQHLYLSIDEIKEMVNGGMFFGSHGYSHEWLSHLQEKEIDLEIEKSLEFLKKINQDRDNLIMSYPYGDYNDLVLKKIKHHCFKAGFTTNRGDSNLTESKAFVLNRYDTNDFPQ